MQDKNRNNVYELEVYVRDLEQQRDKLEETEKEIWQREDDEDLELTYHNRNLDQMGFACSPGDTIILQLIEEKQQMICNMRNKKAEFEMEFKQEMKMKRHQIDVEMEEIHRQLSSIEISEKSY